MGRRCWLTLCVVLCLPSLSARAQPDAPETLEKVGVVQAEEPDPTRLDVVRLPPEAAPPGRALFARGGYVDVHLGVRAFAGDVGKVARPGPMMQIAGGYELSSYFALGVGLVGSIHRTDNSPPPSQTSFEAFEALAHLRLTWPFHDQASLWLRGEGGMFLSTGDVLRALGFKRGDDIVGSAGGSLGFDWHLRGRHHSLGVEAGTHVLPGLDVGGVSLSVHGSAYLHYVF